MDVDPVVAGSTYVRAADLRATQPSGATTMRFMMMHKVDKNSEAGLPPPPEVIAAIGQLMQEMAAAGLLLGGEGLRPSSFTVRLNFSEGRRSVTRGPFAVSNGLIADFSLIRAASMDEAVEWATRLAAIVGDVEIDIGIACEPWDMGMCPKPDGLTTTRFMLMRKADSKSESGARPSPQVTAGIRKLTEEMMRAGALISAEALEPSSKGWRLNYADDECVVTDGPFIESKELIGGFGLAQSNSPDEVLEWATRFARIVAVDGKMEIDVRLVREPTENG
jgi:hypothetical protein